MQSAFLLLSSPPATRRTNLKYSSASWDEMQESSNEPPLPHHHHQQLSSTLRDLLVESAASISSRDFHRAIHFLVLLSRAVSPNGDSTERLAAYFSAALARSVYFLAGRYDSNIHSLLYSHNLLVGPDFHQEFESFPADEEHSAYRALNQVTPFIRFAHLSANQAILEAVDDDRAVHIVDLEIMQGLQWPPLMQALAERRRSKEEARSATLKISTEEDDPQAQQQQDDVGQGDDLSLTLRITGTGSSTELLEQTGARLRDFARTLNLDFEFNGIICGEDSGSISSSLHQNLEIRTGEALVVNCMTQLHRLLRRAALPAALEFIKNLSPRIVTVAEKEFESHDDNNFMGRFLAALDHYAAVFDSLEATLSPRNIQRLMIERLVLAKEIVGLVLEDDPTVEDESYQRLVVRYQSFSRWKQGIQGAGFRLVTPSDFSIAQARLLLRLHYPADGYRLVCDENEGGQGGGLFLCWHNKPLVALSAWSCP